MNFTLDKKILLGLGACTLVLIIVGFISYRNSEKFKETNEWVDHTHKVLYGLEQILVTQTDAETSMRGYVITGKDNFLNPYNKATAQVQQNIDYVKDLTIDNPTQQKRIAEINDLIHAHLNHLDSCIKLRNSDFALAQLLVSSENGKRIMDKIRANIDEAKDMEFRLLTERKITSEKDAKDFNSVFIALIVAIVIVLIAVYIIIVTNLNALRTAEKETAEKNWSLSGSSTLAQEMQGNQAIQELGRSVIDHLVPYLNASLGAVYIANDSGSALHLSSGYALTKAKKDVKTIRFGEGLIGQVAQDKKTIVLTDIPSDNFILDSGMGEINPANILIAPILYENNTVGIIELGSMKPFTDIQKSYITLVMDSIAIAITSAQSRGKITELLEETQRQAEELEAQQEELKQFNEELQVKTELLEKSEADLRAQQEELHQSNEELEEKANLLEAQKETLENAKIQIETKARELELTSKYKSEFLANMSHELRTPLNSILILSQLLIDNKNATLNEKEVEFAQNICNSGSDLLELINEILDLSKVEAGKLDLDIEDVSLNKISNSMHAMFDEVAKKKAINFKIECEDSLLKTSIHTDRQRLEQIIRNLLSNAFKFTSNKGFVIFKMGAVPETVVFRNKDLNAHNCLALSVTDSGIGIPKNKQQIIFEAFQQVDGSTKRKYGGTGLGLSISRELSTALGGEIHVQSEEGKGSTFTLFLPYHYIETDKNQADQVVEKNTPDFRKQENTSSVQSTSIEDTTPEEFEDFSDDRYNLSANDKIILLMEDDIVFAKLMLDFLRERNYKGIIATRGNTGLSYARQYKPDAIMLDMKLPVMDGAEVLKQLKNDPALRHIPVQIISGYDRKREGLELGAFDYILKPVTKDVLLNAFDRIEDFGRKKLKKLLVVEDNEVQNNAIRELIGNGDVKSYSAFTGKEAYDMLVTDAYDCIIVDLGLPDMSGFDLIEKIKETQDIKGIPIIVYTGRDLTLDEKNILNKLASAVVLKTANSQERLLDETTLFLHRVESKLPKEKQRIIRKLHKTEEILKSKKVLVVDDDIRNVYSLTNALEEEEMQCFIAENGKVALQVLAENPSIEIVLMDVMMPEMDGYEATKAIRSMPQFDKIPIIAITAKAMKGDREKCLAAGMSDYISKPVNIEQLLSLMRVWLYN
ncbi:response regulator [Cytophaga aurantiaca]|uniref:response regulator n=1 Tax=Cytophaga aurantiaca TaxID=29530 RepID=UPI000376C9A5|nr:response regulator [Cytophaga aurantiaca]